MIMNTSMALTISTIVASFIVQFLGTPLESIGIEVTEEQLQSTFLLPILTSIIGAINAAHKRSNKKTVDIVPQFPVQPQTVVTQHTVEVLPNIQHEGKLTPQLKGTWYKTNMTTDKEHGNVLNYGSPYLYAKIEDTKSYTTAQLWKDGSLIQIEQGGVNETVRLEMFEKVNGVIQPMSKGKYELRIFGDRGTSDGTGIGKDEFWIV